jgi:hypothetical protein
MFVPEEQTPGPSPTLTSAATGIDPVGLGGITRLYSLGPVGPTLDRSRTFLDSSELSRSW